MGRDCLGRVENGATCLEFRVYTLNAHDIRVNLYAKN